MKEFMKFYQWGMYFKLHMGIYFVALLCVYCVVELCKGNVVVSIWTMLEMLLVMMVTALIESYIVHSNREYSKEELIKRSVIWTIFMNVAFIVSSYWFHWFEGLLMWHYLLLLFVLEMGLLAMWFGVVFVQSIESKALNEGLKKYQK